MVSDDPESFADLDGHDGVLDTIFRLAGESINNPGPAVKNLAVGAVKGLLNLGVQARNAITSGLPSMDHAPTPELKLNNQGEAIGASAATTLLFSAVGGAMSPGMIETTSSPETLTEGLIYRNGGANPANLTMRGGEDALSFRDSLSDPVGEGTKPVFTSDRYTVVDASKLPQGSAVRDNNPAGHVSVTASPGEVKAAVVGTGKFPKQESPTPQSPNQQ